MTNYMTEFKILFPVAIATIGIVASFVIMKYQGRKNMEEIEKLWDRSETHYRDITVLKTKQESLPTMKEVREEFVEIKMWRMQNKHVDERFDKLDKTTADGFKTVSESLAKISTSICPAM